jgi:hypothetical protein
LIAGHEPDSEGHHRISFEETHKAIQVDAGENCRHVGVILIATGRSGTRVPG